MQGIYTYQEKFYYDINSYRPPTQYEVVNIYGGKKMKQKIIALFLTAIMAATYFGIVLAVNNLGTYPAPFCSGGVCAFYTVYGSGAKAEDLVGGSDVTARLAGENYVLTSTTGGTTSSVTGEGARLDTTSDKIFLGNTLENARTGITSTDLPTLLKAGTVVDDNGNSYAYTQDITIDDGASVTFDTASGNLNDPAVYISFPSSSITDSNYIYSTRVTFSKPLNITSTSIIDQTIKLLGTEYTIGTGSAYTASTQKLVLFGGANVVTLKDGEEQPVTISGTEYTVKNVGASDATHAVISVNGVTKSAVKGSTYTISGLDIYVSDIYYYSKEAAVSSVKLSLGSQKLTLDGLAHEVTFGTSDTLDNIYVVLTGTTTPDGTISKVQVFVGASDSETAYILVGKDFEDPVWKTFKLAFSSTTPALDDTNSDSIVATYSGDRGITVKFTDYNKNEKTIEFAYNNVTSLSSVPTTRLMDNDKYEYVIKEGQSAYYKWYVIVDKGDESHLLQVYNIPDGKISTAGTDSVKLKDMMTGTIYEKTISPANDCIAGYCNVSMQIGSNSYFVKLVNGTTKQEGYVQITWDDSTACGSGDTGATYGSAGTYTRMFPGIKAKNGEYIYFVNNYTTIAGGTKVCLPGDTSDSDRLWTVGQTATALVGAMNFTYNSTGSDTYLTVTPIKSYATGIAILEEKQTEASNRKDLVYLYVTDDGGSTSRKIRIDTPTTFMTDTTSGLATLKTLGSNSNIQQAYDIFGTKLVKDTTASQYKITVTYPDDQIYTNIFFLTTGATVSSTSTGGGTIKKVVPISDSVAKLDTDITDPATVNKNLVLVGGSCANSLVQKLVDSGKLDAKFTCTGGTPGAGWETGKGYIFYVADAFATGYDAIVIAGTNAIDTRNACSVIQKYDNTEIAAKLTGQTKVAVTAVSGAGITALT
jgi:hypothetical protein